MQWRNKFPFQDREQCDFCGSRSFQKVAAYDDLQIVRCSCGYVFMNPFLSEEGSREIFSQGVGNFFSWLRRYSLDLRPSDKPPSIIQIYERSLIKLERERKQPGRLLDVGCGRGDFLDMARRRGWLVEGVDFDTENIQGAKKAFQLSVAARRLEEISTTGAPYDVITMWDYFEHVEKPLATLRLAKSLLSHDGMLVIACPNYHGLIFRFANLLHKMSGGHMRDFLRPLYPPTHLSYFFPEFLTTVCRREAFSVLEIEYDETDLDRVSLNPALKLAMALFFKVALMCRASNRFMIYLKNA